MPESPDRLTAALRDRYRIERELGQGGMATVYLAEDLKHHRQVAIKVLKPELAAVLGAERFVQEITTTAALQHPHILPLFDSGEADGFLYYVMPYIEGETLRDRLNRETQLGIEPAVRIAAEVADALDYAHRNGVIHRDIKPENILLHDGRPMVADFGIALALSAAAGGRMTETGMSLGTPHYMSPEQATADKEITARSDVYSLGSVLYEMLTGEPPHMGNSAQAIIMKIVTEDAAPVTRLRRSVPPNVAAAVAKAVERLPADRFESARAFADALQNPAYGQGTTAGVPYGAPGHLNRGLRGNRPALVLGAIAVLALAGLLAAWITRPPPPERRVIRFQVTVPAGAINPVGPRLALSPDGGTFAFIAPAEQNPNTLHVRHLDRLETFPLAGPAYSPAVSPDGTAIAFVSSTSELRVVPLGGGSPRTVQTGVSGNGGIAWGRDGYLYYNPQEGDFGVWRVPATGGTATRVVAPDSLGTIAGYSAPRFVEALPSGRGVLVSFYRGPGELSDVAAVDIASGRVTYLAKGLSGKYAAGRLLYVGPDGALMAAPFDERKLKLTGPPESTGIVVLQEGEAAAAFAISGSGTLLYASPAAGRSLLAWVDRGGTEEVVDNDLWRTINAASLSPDGKRIAMSLSENGQGAIWTYSLERKTLSRLTFDGTLVFRPLWSPDGSRIAYVSDRESPDRHRALWIQPADGSGEPTLLASTERYVQELTWSADGRSAAYREGYSDGKTQRDIYILRAGDDTTRRPFVATGADEQNPQLSPDGHWLAYTSDESGIDRIYVRPFPTGAGRWQVSTGGGIEPLWRRDGRELFYRDPAGNLVAVPVLAGSGFAMGPQKVLFSATRYYSDGNHTSYDVTPDGRRFLMIMRPVDETLVMVTNWVEELQGQ